MKNLIAQDEAPAQGNRQNLRLTYHEDAQAFWLLA
jgi:hypothetical protein